MILISLWVSSLLNFSEFSKSGRKVIIFDRINHNFYRKKAFLVLKRIFVDKKKANNAANVIKMIFKYNNENNKNPSATTLALKFICLIQMRYKISLFSRNVRYLINSLIKVILYCS